MCTTCEARRECPRAARSGTWYEALYQEDHEAHEDTKKTTV